MDETIFSLLAPQDLAGFQNSVQSRDPFQIASQSLQAWQPNYSYMNGAESGMTAFGKAFLSGLAGNYAQNRAADQLSSVINVLPSLTSNPLGTPMPEGVDSSAFNLLRGSAALRKMQRDAVLGDQRRTNLTDILKTVAGEGIKSGQMSAQDAINLAIEGKIPETVDPLAGLNKTQRDAAEKELTSEAMKSKSLDFITDKFKQAKGLVGKEALLGNVLGTIGLPNDKSAALTGLGDSLVVQVDTALGRELNSDVRERLLSLTPKWYDDDKTLSRKETDFKELVSSLFGATPNLNRAGVTTPNLENPVITAQPQPAMQQSLPPLTQDVYNQLRAQGLSGEEIKAKYSNIQTPRSAGGTPLG